MTKNRCVLQVKLKVDFWGIKRRLVLSATKVDTVQPVSDHSQSNVRFAHKTLLTPEPIAPKKSQNETILCILGSGGIHRIDLDVCA
jgi:hypothetical protein